MPNRVPLVVTIGCIVLAVGTSSLLLMSRSSPDFAKFKQIRKDMTKAQVIAIMNRLPDEYLGTPWLGGAHPWPPPVAAEVGELIWDGDDYWISVTLDLQTQKVLGKSWEHEAPEPFWRRVHRWLSKVCRPTPGRGSAGRAIWLDHASFCSSPLSEFPCGRSILTF